MGKQGRLAGLRTQYNRRLSREGLDQIFLLEPVKVLGQGGQGALKSVTGQFRHTADPMMARAGLLVRGGREKVVSMSILRKDELLELKDRRWDLNWD